jgi:uncharacterized protein (TIGR02145 family)
MPKQEFPVIRYFFCILFCLGAAACSWMDVFVIDDGEGASSSSGGGAVSSSSALAQGAQIFDTLEHGGYRYPMARIGDQVWLAKNMNGVPEAGSSWCYAERSSNCDLYGRLYDFEAAAAVCPEGWRLPTQGDWNALLNFVNEATGQDAAGIHLKAGSLWRGQDGLDRFGFSALPGGFRSEGGDFTMLQERAYWWSSEKDAENAYYRNLSDNSDFLLSGYFAKGRGYSVRCIKKPAL